MEEERWIERAKKNGFVTLAIVLDLEDKEKFPMFFQTSEDFFKFQKNIISEWKIKIVKIYEL